MLVSITANVEDILLHASAVIAYYKQDYEEVEIIENGVSKKILSAQKYVPTCTLRGEIEPSMMKTWIMKM